MVKGISLTLLNNEVNDLVTCPATTWQRTERKAKGITLTWLCKCNEVTDWHPPLPPPGKEQTEWL